MSYVRKIFFTILLASITLTFAEAKTKPTKISRSSAVEVKRPTQASLIVDAKTGNVLHSENANHLVYPASLTKMMTLYITFSNLQQKKISMHTMLPVSKYGQKAKPSKLGLVEGQSISVGDAVMALIVKSANDVAVTVAEGIGGSSEEKFATKMNATAQALGMHNTHFTNASGWHDPRQLTTAVDMAKLGLALKRDFPEYYPLFKKTTFTFKGKVIKGHNNVLAQYAGAEGLKTGYHIPSGFNLATTASRNGKSLIGIVTGGESARARDKKMMALLDKHFGVENVRYAALDTTTLKNKKTPTKKITSTNKKYPSIKIASASSKAKKRSKTRV